MQSVGIILAIKTGKKVNELRKAINEIVADIEGSK